jgi:hypothetical protein
MEHQPTTKLNVFYGLDLDNIFREGEKSVTANINPNTGEPITNPVTNVSQVWQDATTTDFGLYRNELLDKFKFSNNSWSKNGLCNRKN